MLHEKPKSLLESSIADALAWLPTAPGLREEQRRQWMCSLRFITKALGRPPELLPARLTALAQPMARLHHTQMGVTAKTLANHKSNARAALKRFGREENVPLRGTPLSPEWALLRDGIVDHRTRANTYSLMRYCSAQGIRPEGVDERAIDSLMSYRAATTALATNAAARRRIARAWNNCVGVVPGWPSHRLVEPPAKSSLAGPPWEEFPAGLRRDIETYLTSLQHIRRIAGGRRRPPCKPKTIKVRRAKLVAFVRKAVSIGIPIGSIVSSRKLLDPDLVERVLDAYWRESGEEPGIYVIELASFLLDIARQAHCLDVAAIARLEDMRAELRGALAGRPYREELGPNPPGA